MLFQTIFFFVTSPYRFGRRVSYFACTATTAVLGILVSVSVSFPMYVVTRFFLAASAHNTFLTGFVLGKNLSLSFFIPF